MSADSQVGTVVGGRYRLVARLGAGGMGIVYRAVHEVTRRQVAVKILPPEHATDAERITLFRKEAMAAAALESRHIVQVLDAGVEAGGAFLVMELLTGRDLEHEIASAGPLPLARAVRVATQLLEALAVAHRSGIVHRDIKPANVFLADRPAHEPELVKVLDFGIAKIVEGSAVTALAGPKTATGAAVGTLAYMSPEQLFGRDVDARTDLYAAGLVLCECLLGRRAIDAESVGELVEQVSSRALPSVAAARPDLPPAIDVFLARACAKDRAERFPDAESMAAALAQVAIDPFGATGLSPAVVGIAAPHTARRPVWAIAAVAVFVSLALAGVVWSTSPVNDVVTPPLVPVAGASELLVAEEDGSIEDLDAATPTRSDAEARGRRRRTKVAPVPHEIAPVPHEVACPSGQLASLGHCCPLGQIWLGSRCGRPLSAQ